MKRFFWDCNKVFVAVDEDVSLKNTIVYINGEKIDKSHAVGGKLGERGRVVLGLLLLNNTEPISSNQIQEYIEDVYNEDCNDQSVFRAVSNIRTSFWGKDLGKKFISPETIDEKEGSVSGYSIHFKEVSSFFKTDYNDEEYNFPQGFVSRNQEINNLIDLFEESKACAICGERGLGKTELAHSFARECKRRNIYDHIIFTHYDESLEKTIKNLETYANPLPGFEDHVFDEKIYLLSEIAKDQKCLLIIDNYDNPEKYNYELSSEKGTYRDLINTGWSVLFTSRTDLKKLPYIGKHVIDLMPFKTKQLVAVFCEVTNSEVSKADIPLLESLINDYLQNNTYLVVLTAVLLEEMTLSEIYEYFKSGQVYKITDPIEPNKDLQLQEADTLFNHYCAVFLNHPLLKNEMARYILFNIALFPLKGVDYDLFFDAAFVPEKISEAKKAFLYLSKNYLVFKQNGRIYLHPLVRELILERIPSIDETFIRQIIFNGLEVQTYTEHYPDWYRLCDSIETALASKFENKKISTYTTACILALISSIKAIVNDETIAYEYGLGAIKMFREFKDFDSFAVKELYLLARSYNVSAYSVLQKKIGKDSTQEKEYYDIVLDTIDNTMSVAESVLFELVKKTQEDREWSEKVRVLQSKIHSNIGACYYKIGKYDDALRWHEIALKERLVFSEKNNALLAASYRCIGSDLYRIAEEKKADVDKLLNYSDSYNYHRMSVDLYLKSDYKKIDRYISYHRLIGSAIEILLLCNKLSLSLEAYDVEKYDDFFVMLNESAQYLTQAEVPDFKLFAECLKHTNDLVDAITLINGLSKDYKNCMSAIIDAFGMYGELPEESLVLLSQLENSLSNLRK